MNSVETPPEATKTLRILVVEDSFMTARMLVRMVQDCGAVPVGPAPSVQKALALIDSTPFDAAILDINLGTETVEPVASKLDQVGVPFFFVSGYSSPKLLSPRYKGHRLIPKPVDPIVFRRAVAEAFQES